jgi:phosphoribosylformylglycinamidine cyclo-ligase
MAVLELLDKVSIKGLAHITGGGITENLPRVFNGDIHPKLDLASWQPGPVFDWLARTGNISDDEMRRTFNCGVGMCAIVSPKDADLAIETLAASGENAWRLGTVEPGGGEVEYD